MSDHLITALRAPGTDRAPRPDQRTLSQSAPRRWPRAALLGLGAAAFVLAGFLSWSAFVRPVSVSVAPVQSNIHEQVFGLGTVGARMQSNVGFKVTGVLTALNADQGDHVQAGQVLARLDARDVEAQLAVARAGVGQARANIDKSKADADSASASLSLAEAANARRATLATKGFLSPEGAQTYQTAERVASANLIAAQSGVKASETALRSAVAQQAFQQAVLANSTLLAPYDAWVVSRNLELGSAATPGQSVFTLVAARSVWVQSFVDERLAGRLRVGQPARITLRSNPSKPIPGHVARIEIQSDPVNEERLVDVAFDQVPQNIHLAEQAEVVITTDTLPRAVLVQPKAVTDLQDGRGLVWTLESGRIARRPVTFGRALLDGRLPIIAGLPSGAAVIAAPASGLRVGREARVAQAPRP